MVRHLTGGHAFSRLLASERAGALLDAGSGRLEADGAIVFGSGEIGGRKVRIACTDPAIAGGSFGETESAALEGLLAQRENEAIVLVLDSAGARLDGGLPALGAFRRLFRTAVYSQLSGRQLIVVIARNCFGGASMLACLGTVRIASAASRFGLSGPGIVEALGGREELDALDAIQVQALYGGEARARIGSIEILCADDTSSHREALAHCLRKAAPGPPGVHERHRMLRARLEAAGLAVPVEPHAAERRLSAGRPLSALDAWSAADWLLGARGSELTVVLNSPGQAASRLDESLVVSEYVAHLALCAGWLRGRGTRVRLRIDGEAAGGIYVALAACAERVQAVRGTTVRLLPARAVARVLGAPLPDQRAEAALAAGVIDEVVSG